MVDTYPCFKVVWMNYSDSGVDQLLEAWAREYMSSFPNFFNLW